MPLDFVGLRRDLPLESRASLSTLLILEANCQAVVAVLRFLTLISVSHHYWKEEAQDEA